MTERILNPYIDTELYNRFTAVASILTAYSPHKAEYVVENTYLDYGQKWIWTTIIRYGHNECQVLYPVDWQNIVKADTMEKLFEVVKNIVKHDCGLDYGKE